jgi:hypothetical protein
MKQLGFCALGFWGGLLLAFALSKGPAPAAAGPISCPSYLNETIQSSRTGEYGCSYDWDCDCTVSLADVVIAKHAEAMCQLPVRECQRNIP